MHIYVRQCVCVSAWMFVSLEISVYNKNDTIFPYLKTIVWFVCLLVLLVQFHFTYFLVVCFFSFFFPLPISVDSIYSFNAQFISNKLYRQWKWTPQNLNLRTKTPQFKTAMRGIEINSKRKSSKLNGKQRKTNWLIAY